MSFFHAPPDYTVIFTANATAALKLVGESFPFTAGSAFVLGVDSHNSVHGIREYATRSGGRVCYIPSTNRGGFEVMTAMVKSPCHASHQQRWVTDPDPLRTFSRTINPSLRIRRPAFLP